MKTTTMANDKRRGKEKLVFKVGMIVKLHFVELILIRNCHVIRKQGEKWSLACA